VLEQATANNGQQQYCIQIFCWQRGQAKIRDPSPTYPCFLLWPTTALLLISLRGLLREFQRRPGIVARQKPGLVKILLD